MFGKLELVAYSFGYINMFRLVAGLDACRTCPRSGESVCSQIDL